MPFELPALPYEKSALAQYMSAETLDYHHGKHHKAYVDKTNAAIAGKDLDGMSLSAVIRAAKERGQTGLFNNAAQLWNHSFFWQCLAPAGQKPTGEFAALIDHHFGSTDVLLEKLGQEAIDHFASGWAWLVLNGDALEITSFHDADTPVTSDHVKPLLTIDVWEHAYYIDYRNARPDFVKAVLGNIINWEFVASNLDGEGVSRADQG